MNQDVEINPKRKQMFWSFPQIANTSQDYLMHMHESFVQGNGYNVLDIHKHEQQHLIPISQNVYSKFIVVNT